MTSTAPTISRHAANLSMAARVDLHSQEAPRGLTAPLYAAIRERLETSALRTITTEAAALERGEVLATYARGRAVTVARWGRYVTWRTVQADGAVGFCYREIR